MSNRTRAEHLAWCKERAHAEYDYYRQKNPKEAVHNAVASMVSDLGKHPETEKLLAVASALGIHTMHTGTEQALFAFIDGFK